MIDEPLGQCPTHCEQCGLPPVNKQLYQLKAVDGVWICSRHPEYPKPAEYQTPRTDGPKTSWDV